MVSPTGCPRSARGIILNRNNNSVQSNTALLLTFVHLYKMIFVEQEKEISDHLVVQGPESLE